MDCQHCEERHVPEEATFFGGAKQRLLSAFQRISNRASTSQDPSLSPRIASQIWGKVDVVGFGSFRDVKLFVGGAREWDWRETGTRHRPGVQVADCKELLKSGAETIVLSRGVHEVLQVPDATVKWLEEQGAEVIVLPTPKAVVRYNELAAAGVAVGALIHSTC